MCYTDYANNPMPLFFGNFLRVATMITNAMKKKGNHRGVCKPLAIWSVAVIDSVETRVHGIHNSDVKLLFILRSWRTQLIGNGGRGNKNEGYEKLGGPVWRLHEKVESCYRWKSFKFDAVLTIKVSKYRRQSPFNYVQLSIAYRQL